MKLGHELDCEEKPDKYWQYNRSNKTKINLDQMGVELARTTTVTAYG